MPRPDSGGARLPSLLIGAVVLLLGFCIYFFSVDAHAPSLLRHNLVFDSDILDVSKVVAEGDYRNVDRHPLSAMLLGGPGSVVDSLLQDRIVTAKCSSAVVAAAAILLGFRCLAELLKSRAAAAWFCLLASFSASVWIFGAIPETHIYNHAAVVFAFDLVVRMGREQAAQRMIRHTGWAIVVGVLLMGITLTNIYYVTVAFGLGLSRLAVPFSRRAGWLVVFLAGVLVLFSALSAVQLYLAPREDNLLKDPLDPVVTKYLRWDRDLDPREMALEARIFLLDSVIASPPRVDVVPTLTGNQQMIQFGAIGRSQVLILAYLAAALLVLLGRRSGAGFGPEGALAGLAIAFNLVLHHFFRGNGQSFIFSIHAVFPLVVLLALVYRNSRTTAKQLVLGALVCAILVHNAFFMRSMNELLDRKCMAEREVGDYEMCTKWSQGPAP